MTKRVIGTLLLLGTVFASLRGQLPGISDFWTGAPPVESVRAMLTTHRCADGRIYWEVPDSLIGRTFAVTTTLISTPARPDRNMEKKFGYAGDMLGPVFFSLRLHGDELRLMDPRYSREIADSTGTYGRIAAQSERHRLYQVLPIRARGRESSLVEVGKLLSEFPLFTLDLYAFELSITRRQAERDRIGQIKGHDDRLLIRADRAYANLTMHRASGTPSPAYVGAWETGLCISLLASTPLEPLPATSGSYFTIDKEYIEGDAAPVRRPIVKRWRLEVPATEREKYLRGEPVEPVRPIVFYIDRHTPERLVPYIIEAVRDWQPAFEAAGFKNAIDARLAPTPEEDPDFCIYDSRYPFISWKVSGQNNAYGPTPCEPRSGEIIACHLGLFSSVVNLKQKWYFAQCGANDPQAWAVVLPDSLMGRLVKQIVAHEIGHTLGLEHNFLGSSHYSATQLRDSAFLQANSIGSSIMDYVRCNYALRPQDRVAPAGRQMQVGAYDRWAVEWGYRLFAGSDAATRQYEREQWYAAGQRNPLLRFSGGVDVCAQAEDLGNDHVEMNTQGIENLKYLCNQPHIWQAPDRLSLHVLQGRYLALWQHYDRWVRHVLGHLGGKRTAEEGGMTIYLPEQADYNRRALHFLHTYLLQPPTWLLEPSLTTAVEVDGRQEFERIYGELMDELMRTLRRVDEAEDADTEMLTADEMLRSLHHALFAPWVEGSAVEELHHRVQTLYTEKLAALLAPEARVYSTRLQVATARALERIRQEAHAYRLRRAGDRLAERQTELLTDLLKTDR